VRIWENGQKLAIGSKLEEHVSMTFSARIPKI